VTSSSQANDVGPEVKVNRPRLRQLQRTQFEVGAGVVPGGGASEWLPALVGRSRALEIIIGANDFDGDTAERYGWVNCAIPDAQLDGFVDDLEHRIASYQTRTIELAKKTTMRARACLPKPTAGLRTPSRLGWPETQAAIPRLFENGFQHRASSS